MSSPSPLNTPVWDDGRWPGLPSLDADLTTEICVIGLGGSGLTAVSELIGMGRAVVGIDAADVAAGAAGRNGGLLLAGTSDFHHDAVTALGRARVLRIHEMTLEEMQRIAEQAPGTVHVNGSIRVAESQDEMVDCALQREAMRDDGLEVRNYDGPMGRGLFIPGDAQFNPLARCRALATQLLEDGALLFANTRALSFSGDKVVTARGRISCQRVIVAVDGRLELLVPELAGRVRTARLEMIATAPTTEIAVPCPVSSRYGFDYWQQLTDGTLVLGGGRDTAIDAEWTMSGEPSQGILEYLERTLRRRLRVLAPITHRWAANVSYTETGLPVLAEVRPAVWAIGGYSGTGNLMGALAGRAVARRACGEPSEFAALLSYSVAPERNQWSASA